VTVWPLVGAKRHPANRRDPNALNKHYALTGKSCRHRPGALMTRSADSSLSLRHLRLRHDDLGEETFAAQRKETLFNIAQHRFYLVSEHGGRR
jgi:hypothetical protein